MRGARHLVLRSVETMDGGRCVDVYRRDDDSFGFEVYRRDSEDGRGWFATGGFGEVRFASEAEAIAAARRTVPWVEWDGASDRA